MPDVNGIARFFNMVADAPEKFEDWGRDTYFNIGLNLVAFLAMGWFILFLCRYQDRIAREYEKELAEKEAKAAAKKAEGKKAK